MSERSVADNVGEALRLARRERGFAQQKLAFLARVDQSHISKIERGLVIPSQGMARKLARALGLPADAFLAGGD